MDRAKRSLELTDLSPDVKAYIHQQLVDFIPYCMPDSTLGAAVQEIEGGDLDEPQFEVTLLITGDGSYVKSCGIGSDIYDAAQNAKVELLNYFSEIEAEVQGDDQRDLQIDQLHENHYIH